MIRRLFSNQLRINIVSGVGATAANVIVFVVAYPIYLHFLGYEKYGIWLVLATVLSFAQLGNLGVGQAIMKLVAEEYGRRDIDAIQRYVTTALALLCISGAAVLVAILVFNAQIVAVFKLTSENAEMVSWLLPYIGVLSVYVFIVQVLNATLSGLGRIDLANCAQLLGRIVAVTVAAVLLYSGRGIESLLIGSAVSYLLIHVISLICIWRITHVRILRISSLDIQSGRRILRFGGGILGGTLVSMLLSPFNKLMLSRYAGVSAIPVYEIAFCASMQVKGLIIAGFKALMPEISRISANLTAEARRRMLQLNWKTTKITLIAGGTFYVLLFSLSPPLLKLWLQDKFVSGLTTAFRVILFGTCFSLMAVPAYYFLLGLGKVLSTFLTNAIRALCNLLLVSAIIITSGGITIEQVSFCVLISWVLSTVFIVYKARCVLSEIEPVVQLRGDFDEKGNIPELT